MTSALCNQHLFPSVHMSLCSIQVYKQLAFRFEKGKEKHASNELLRNYMIQGAIIYSKG